MSSLRNSASGGTARKVYNAPKLTNFGGLSVLTAGGSMGATENQFINAMTCGPNPLAKCG